MTKKKKDCSSAESIVACLARRVVGMKVEVGPFCFGVKEAYEEDGGLLRLIPEKKTSFDALWVNIYTTLYCVQNGPSLGQVWQHGELRVAKEE